MCGKPSDDWVSPSDAIYQLLLFLYPAAHRREYGPLMAQAFHDLAQDRYGRAGLKGLLALWLNVFPDVAVSAAFEHWEVLTGAGSAGHGEAFVVPRPWWQMSLAVLPGLFLLGLRSGLFRTVLGLSVAHSLASIGVALLALVLVIASLVHRRRLPAWSFPALGLLVYALPAALADLLTPGARSGPAPDLNFVAAILPFVFLFLALVLVWRGRRTLAVPGSTWRLAGWVAWLLVASEIFVAVLADRSAHPWRAALSTGMVAIWWTVSLLLPVTLGLLPARRAGLLAGLIVLAGEFWLVDGLFDPSYALGMWTSNQFIVTLVNLLPALFLLVVAPIWMLRARSARMRLAGMLIPALLALLGGELVGAMVRPYYAEIWVTRAVSVGHFMAALALAALIYDRAGSAGAADRPAGRRGERTPATARDGGLSAGKQLNWLAAWWQA